MLNKKGQINFNTFLIVGLILIFIIAIKGGYLQNIINIPQPPQPSTPAPDKVIVYTAYDANLDISPNDACVGDTLTGRINSNIPNGYCDVYVDVGKGFNMFMFLELDSNGDYTQSETISTAGNANFVAVCCDREDKCTLSNYEWVTVRNCDCVDSDGEDRDKPGNVLSGGLRYYDKCSDVGEVVQEYICVSGRVTSKNLNCDANEECYTTRSGGYCRPIVSGTCSDTDGKNYYVQGVCTDASASTIDVCPMGDFTSFVNEEWCESGVCMGVSFDCSSEGARCYQGKCIKTNQDSDGDGFFDLDELEVGTDPNNPNSKPSGPNQNEIFCINTCSGLGFAGSNYQPSWNEALCDSFAQDKCVNVFHVQYIDSFYTTTLCCCYQCAWA